MLVKGFQDNNIRTFPAARAVVKHYFLAKTLYLFDWYSDTNIFTLILNIYPTFSYPVLSHGIPNAVQL